MFREVFWLHKMKAFLEGSQKTFRSCELDGCGYRCKAEITRDSGFCSQRNAHLAGAEQRQHPASFPSITAAPWMSRLLPLMSILDIATSLLSYMRPPGGHAIVCPQMLRNCLVGSHPCLKFSAHLDRCLEEEEGSLPAHC